MWSLLAHVLPLAIGAAISPALLAVTLEVLATAGANRRRLLWAYLVGAASPLLGLGLVAVFALPSFLEHGLAGERTVVDVVQLVLGVLLVLLAVTLAVRRPHRSGDEDVTGHKSPTPPHVGRYVVAGVGMMLTNTSTLLLFVAGVHEIVSADASAGAAAIALAVLVLGGVAPIWLPLLADELAPHATQRALAPLASLIRRHGPAIGSVVAAVTGIYLIGRGARWW